MFESIGRCITKAHNRSKDRFWLSERSLNLSFHRNPENEAKTCMQSKHWLIYIIHIPSRYETYGKICNGNRTSVTKVKA